MLEQRKLELTEFYAEHEPAKISAVGTLLETYPFADIVGSLRHKYGAVPKGWDNTGDLPSPAENLGSRGQPSVSGGGAPPASAEPSGAAQFGEDVVHELTRQAADAKMQLAEERDMARRLRAALQQNEATHAEAIAEKSKLAESEQATANKLRVQLNDTVFKLKEAGGGKYGALPTQDEVRSHLEQQLSTKDQELAVQKAELDEHKETLKVLTAGGEQDALVRAMQATEEVKANAEQTKRVLEGQTSELRAALAAKHKEMEVAVATAAQNAKQEALAEASGGSMDEIIALKDAEAASAIEVLELKLEASAAEKLQQAVEVERTKHAAELEAALATQSAEHDARVAKKEAAHAELLSLKDAEISVAKSAQASEGVQGVDELMALKDAEAASAIEALELKLEASAAEKLQQAVEVERTKHAAELEAALATQSAEHDAREAEKEAQYAQLAQQQQSPAVDTGDSAADAKGTPSVERVKLAEIEAKHKEELEAAVAAERAKAVEEHGAALAEQQQVHEQAVEQKLEEAKAGYLELITLKDAELQSADSPRRGGGGLRAHHDSEQVQAMQSQLAMLKDILREETEAKQSAVSELATMKEALGVGATTATEPAPAQVEEAAQEGGQQNEEHERAINQLRAQLEAMKTQLHSEIQGRQALEIRGANLTKAKLDAEREREMLSSSAAQGETMGLRVVQLEEQIRSNSELLALAQAEAQAQTRRCASARGEAEVVEQKLKEMRQRLKQTESQLQQESQGRETAQHQAEALEQAKSVSDQQLKALRQRMDNLSPAAASPVGSKGLQQLETYVAELQGRLADGDSETARQPPDLAVLDKQREYLQLQLDHASQGKVVAEMDTARLSDRRKEEETKLERLVEERMAAEKKALSIQFPATQLQQMETNVVELREQLRVEAESRTVVEALVAEEAAARAVLSDRIEAETSAQEHIAMIEQQQVMIKSHFGELNTMCTLFEERCQSMEMLSRTRDREHAAVMERLTQAKDMQKDAELDALRSQSHAEVIAVQTQLSTEHEEVQAVLKAQCSTEVRRAREGKEGAVESALQQERHSREEMLEKLMAAREAQHQVEMQATVRASQYELESKMKTAVILKESEIRATCEAEMRTTIAGEQAKLSMLKKELEVKHQVREPRFLASSLAAPSRSLLIRLFVSYRWSCRMQWRIGSSGTRSSCTSDLGRIERKARNSWSLPAAPLRVHSRMRCAKSAKYKSGSCRRRWMQRGMRWRRI
jgi:hypothetical protein